jgi:hypothetical protein
VRDLETSWIRRPWPTLGRSATKNIIFHIQLHCCLSAYSNNPSYSWDIYLSCDELSSSVLLSSIVTDCHRLSQTVTDCHRMSQTVTDCHRMSQTVTDCHRLSQTITDCHRLATISKFVAAKILLHCWKQTIIAWWCIPQTQLQPYTLVLVSKMELVCRNERFTAAGTLCPRELETLDSWREINQAFVLAVGRKCRYNGDGHSMSCTQNRRVCQMVHCAVH